MILYIYISQVQGQLSFSFQSLSVWVKRRQHKVLHKDLSGRSDGFNKSNTQRLSIIIMIICWAAATSDINQLSTIRKSASFCTFYKHSYNMHAQLTELHAHHVVSIVFTIFWNFISRKWCQSPVISDSRSSVTVFWQTDSGIKNNQWQYLVQVLCILS